MKSCAKVWERAAPRRIALCILLAASALAAASPTRAAPLANPSPPSANPSASTAAYARTASASASATDVPSVLRIELRPQLVLARPAATLGDLAVLSGPGAELASALVVQAMPGSGPWLIDARTVRAAIGTRPAHIVGQTVLSRAMRRIGIDALSAAASAAALADLPAGDELDLRLVRSSSPLDLPDDGIQPDLVAEPLDRAGTGEIAFRVRALRGERELARALVVLELVRWRSCLVPTRAIAKGETLTVGDLHHERLRLTRTTAAALADASVLIGRQARLPLTAGAAILPNQLVTPVDIRGGSTVELVFASGAVVLTSTGVALSDGSIGDAIAVRRAGDGRTVHGTVVAAGQVQVRTP